MKLSTKIYLIVLAFFFIATVGLSYLYQKARAEAKRQTSNVENLVKKQNQVLALTHGEWEKSETVWRYKVDSLLEVIKVNANKVKVVTIINTQYQDTGSVIILGKEPISKPDKSYSIPVSYSDKCWGMAGQILTTDPRSRLQIDKRTATNSSQLLVLRSRFLGFLWWKKGEDYRLYSDCGESDFTKISFIKK